MALRALQGPVSGTPVGGTGTTNYIPRWNPGPSTLGDSIISQDTNARAIGIGVTPSATWDTSYRAIQLGQTASAMAASAAAANWWTQNNGIWDGTNWKYTAAGAGAQYAQIGGEHRFSYVAAGAAGANFTWSRAVTIDISGNVGIGTASPGARLHAYGSAANGSVAIVERSTGDATIAMGGNAANTAAIHATTGTTLALGVGASYSSSNNFLNITSAGNIYGTSGTTGMTNGFFYIPAAAGAPTGTPTAVSGRVPMYYDTTNNEFYVYNGAWKKVALA